MPSPSSTVQFYLRVPAPIDPVGVKGKDGSTVSSVTNPVPVEIQGSLTIGTEIEIKNDAGNPVPVQSNGLTNADIGQMDVIVTETAIPVTVGSKTVALKALGANAAAIYINETGVSATNGWELSAGDSIEIDVSDAVPLYAVSASGTQRLCFAKVS